MTCTDEVFGKHNVAVFDEDVISNYQQFLARRRAERLKEEYRDPTPEE